MLARGGRRGSSVRRPGAARRSHARARSSARCTRRPPSPARGAAGPAWRAALAYQETGETPPEAVPGVVEIERLRDGPVTELYASAPPRAPLRPERRGVARRGCGSGGATRRRSASPLEQSAAAWSTASPASRGLTAERVGELPARRVGLRILRFRGQRAREPRRGLRRRPAGPRPLAADGRRAALRDVARGRRDRRGPHRVDDAVAAHRRALAADRRGRPLRGMGARPSAPSAAVPAVGRSRRPAGPRLPLGRRRGRTLRVGGAGAPRRSASGPGGAYSSIDGALRSPQTAGVVAGFDVRPGDGWWIRFAGIHRRVDRPRRVREHRRHRRRLRRVLHRRSGGRLSTAPPTIGRCPIFARQPVELRTGSLPAHQRRRITKSCTKASS